MRFVSPEITLFYFNQFMTHENFLAETAIIFDTKQ